MAKVEFQGVTKVFGKVSAKKTSKTPAVVAVNNLTFTMPDKEFLVIVGPSGCGKTTMLRLLAGLEDQDNGHILIDDQIVDEVPVGKRGVHMVFQNYALWPHMKVFNEKDFTNMGFGPKVRKWLPEAITNRVHQVSRTVGLESKLFNRKPSQLSEGQKQRVAIGRSLVVLPRVLLLDEPMANLDAPSRVQIRTELRKLHDENGLTTLCVTHNMSDGLAMADRIAVMKDGSFVQVASAQELWDHPANQFVADFLAAYSAPRAFGAGR